MFIFWGGGGLNFETLKLNKHIKHLIENNEQREEESGLGLLN